MFNSPRIYSALFLFLFVVGCSKQSPATGPDNKDPHPKLTMENVGNFCPKASEVYPVPVMSLYTIVGVFEKCLDYDDLFMATWFGEITELERTSAKLLVLTYSKYRRQALELECSPVLLKFSEGSGKVPNAGFYSLNCKSIKKPEPHGDPDAR